MQGKYFAGAVQPLGKAWAKEDLELMERFRHVEEELKGYMAELCFHRALEAIWGAIDHTNRYIVRTSPFTVIRDPAEKARVGEILHHLLESLRALAGLLSAFLPETAERLRELLNLSESTAQPGAAWGACFAEGHTVKPPKVLFPRIETEPKK
jgi:methionyl-tRNA synthetase